MWLPKPAALALIVACAPPPAPRPSAAAQVASTEVAAFECERRINAAEKALTELQPDQALTELEVASKSFADPRIDDYPEVGALRDRHRALLARVPLVREEVRRRDLAAAITAARATLDPLRGRATEAFVRLKKRGANEDDVTSAGEVVGALKAAIAASSKLEDRDVGYAKYSLAAQKELAALATAVEERALVLGVQRGRARIDEAKKALAAAMKKIADKNAAEPDFLAAKGALAEAEKALEGVETKDRDFSSYVTESRKALVPVRAEIDKRRTVIEVAAQRARLEEAHRALNGALKGMTSEESIASAETALASLETVITEGEKYGGRSPEYLKLSIASLKSTSMAKKQIRDRREALAKDAQAVKARDQIGVAEVAIERAMVLVERATSDSATDADVTAAAGALVAAKEELRRGDALEKESTDYASFAVASRKQITAAQAAVETARHGVAFREGPVAALSAGLRALASAEQKSGGEQKAAYEKALEHFRACQKDAAAIIVDAPKLASALFPVADGKATGSTVIQTCAQAIKRIR